MPPKQDHYAVLGVSPDATMEDIKRAYRRLALTHHPDVSVDKHGHDAFHDASEAYKVLSDPIQRKAYDDKAGIHRDPDGSHQPHVFTDTSSYETVTHSPMAPWMVGQSSLTPEQQYFVARDQMKLRSERPGNAFNNNVRVKSFVAAKEARRQARSGVALWLLAPFVAAGLWVAAMRSQPA